eukprot:2633872-Pleurochrysis_carterae.AAC.1
MFTSRPTSERAFRQCTRALSRASRCMSAMLARRSVRLLSGQRSRPAVAPRLKPSVVTGSPATTFAGAAYSPSSARPCTTSCAWTYTREATRAGVPPTAA